MSGARQRVPAANDNETWSDESYFRLVKLSGQVLTTILKRLTGRHSIEAQKIAGIIRQVCRPVSGPDAPPCPGTLMIERVACRLESDGPCL